MGVKFDGLAVGHPDRCGEALHAGRRPQRQNVDAGVGLAVMTQRSRDAPGGMFGVPRLEPGPDAFLKLAHDLIGDTLINIGSHCLFLRWLSGSHETD